MWRENVSPKQLVDHSEMICYAAKWEDGSYITFDSIFKNSKEDMLKRLHALLDEADAVVHYNGKSFDIPIINTEFIEAGLLPPSPYHQIDLLRVVRKHFRFPHNKLDYIVKRLELGGKVEHTGFDLWLGCMQNKPKDWATMEKYNRQDVKILQSLYRKLLPWIDNHPNQALHIEELDRPVCTTCGSDKVIKKGTVTTKTGEYQRYRCKKCGSQLRERYSCVPSDMRKNILTTVKL
jgi:DNA polymerase elongation subunit (family B)